MSGSRLLRWVHLLGAVFWTAPPFLRRMRGAILLRDVAMPPKKKKKKGTHQMICGAMQPLPTAGSPTISETSFREQWLHWDTKTRARSSCSRITKRKISSDTHELKKKLIAPRNSGFLLTKKKNLQGLSETPQSPTRYPKSSADAEA